MTIKAISNLVITQYLRARIKFLYKEGLVRGVPSYLGMSEQETMGVLSSFEESRPVLASMLLPYFYGERCKLLLILLTLIPRKKCKSSRSLSENLVFRREMRCWMYLLSLTVTIRSSTCTKTIVVCWPIKSMNMKVSDLLFWNPHSIRKALFNLHTQFGCFDPEIFVTVSCTFFPSILHLEKHCLPQVV